MELGYYDGDKTQFSSDFTLQTATLTPSLVNAPAPPLPIRLSWAGTHYL